MKNVTLAASYLQKARTRLDMLGFLMGRSAYSDVVREAQEAVELALKGILRQIGVEPPKVHDVGGLLVEYRDKLPPQVSGRAEALAEISKWLRKEREFALYGDVDFIPTAEYTRADAQRALDGAREAVEAAGLVIPE